MARKNGRQRGPEEAHRREKTRELPVSPSLTNNCDTIHRYERIRKYQRSQLAPRRIRVAEVTGSYPVCSAA